MNACWGLIPPGLVILRSFGVFGLGFLFLRLSLLYVCEDANEPSSFVTTDMFGLNPSGSNPESSSEYSRGLLGGDVVGRWEEVLGRSLSGEEVGEVFMPEE